MYYSLASYYTEDLTCYIIEVLKYCTTPYVAPAYTTQAPEYYTFNRGFSILHYNLRCSKQLH